MKGMKKGKPSVGNALSSEEKIIPKVKTNVRTRYQGNLAPKGAIFEKPVANYKDGRYS